MDIVSQKDIFSIPSKNPPLPQMIEFATVNLPKSFASVVSNSSLHIIVPSEAVNKGGFISIKINQELYDQ